MSSWIMKYLIAYTAGVLTTVAVMLLMPAPRAAGPAASASSVPASGLVQFGSGRLPITFEPMRPVSLAGTGEIDIAGTVAGAGATVVLRVDDGQSIDYGSRINIERRLPPGPFHLPVRIDALRTDNGRTLDASDIRRVIFFAVEGGEGVSVDRFETQGAGVPPAATPARGAAGPAASASSVPASGLVQFGSGRLPIAYRLKDTDQFANTEEIRIDGINLGQEPVGLVLRVDDGQSSDYSSRFNDERSFPSGPFHYQRSLSGLKTPSGRIINSREIRRIVFGMYEGVGPVEISRFEAGEARRLPKGVDGYALGAMDAVLPPGFERIGAKDGRLQGQDITVVRRPGPDPLVANGLRGVRRISLPTKLTRARVTLWLEDPGEWELLPHPLVREIQVNGRKVVSVRQTFQDWIEKRYLRGASAEHTRTDDAWTAYGKFRGDPRFVDVDVADGSIDIDFAGTASDALFLSAVTVEPAGQTNGADAVEAARADWYRSNYFVGASDEPDIAAIPVRVDGEGRELPKARLTIAPDTGARLKFSVLSKMPIAEPSISVEQPALGGQKLSVRIWAGQRRLERSGASSSALALRDNRLIANLEQLPLLPDQPRNYELWIHVPATVKDGLYSGAINFGSKDTVQRVPIEVHVPAVQLPKPTKPAGFYLADAPQLTWFAPLIKERSVQAGCDLELMRSFGLTGTAPPASISNPENIVAFLADMQLAKERGVSPGWLVYNPAQSVLERLGLTGSADFLAKLDNILKQRGLPDLTWSIADEPGNPDQQQSHLEEWVQALRARTPHIRLAAHLNSAHDERFIPLFDTILINDGFGLDANRINRAAAHKRDVWLYNTNAPRLTAGLWLWSTAATRYVQWHGRLPTADPFDPLDGREGDAQMIYPSLEVCSRQPDIHRTLLKAAEGVVDQRWLLWLSRQSSPQARDLTNAIKLDIGGEWKAASKKSGDELTDIRDKIIAFSRGLAIRN